MAAETAQFDESKLTKGQLRKLTALRKSLGQEIADKAFAEWMQTFGATETETTDKNATLIAETLGQLIEKKKLQIPRGGYFLRRGRGRVIVEKLADEKK
jgi:hypothetical protein